MALLHRHILDFCPLNVFRPTFPDGLSARTRSVMVDIYNDAVSRDVDEFKRNLAEVYCLGSDVNVPVLDYDSMLEYYSNVLSKRSLSLRDLLRLNLQGCVWHTTPALYNKLQHSFHGVDGDASYTWTTVLCTATLLLSCFASSFKVSACYTVQFAYSIATLVLYNTYFMFTRSGEYLVLAVALHLVTVALFCGLNPYKPSFAGPTEGAAHRFGDMIVYMRGQIMIATVIAIIAYDNVNFNRLCSKTFFNGYSSMDVGCGFMIVHSGCMTSLSRNTRNRTTFDIIRRNWALFLLGIVRLLATAAVDYDVPVEEYGVHWNFFLSLGVTKILSEMLLSVVPRDMLGMVPLFIMVVFELILYRFDMVHILPSIPRTNLLAANKEGIIAIPNSITLFFIGYLVASRCNRLYKDHNRRSSSLLEHIYSALNRFAISVIALSLGASFALYKLGLTSSRTLANARFVMNTVAIVFVTFFHVMVLDLIPDGLVYKETLRSIGKHSFSLFVVANLITGAVNLFIRPLLLPFAVMYTLVVFYGCICCVLALFLERPSLASL